MDATFTDASDICQQLLDRYGKSAAPQHRHLCAIAAATRSIIQSESLPLTPISYFAATISTLSDQTQLDQEALAALSTFLSIVLTLVPEKAIAPDKAKEAMEVVVEKVNSNDGAVSTGTASARALVKCLGILVGFSNLDDWDSVEFGFNILLRFSSDKRPKVFHFGSFYTSLYCIFNLHADLCSITICVYFVWIFESMVIRGWLTGV